MGRTKNLENINLATISKSLPNYFEEIEIVKSEIFILDFMLKNGLELGSTVQLVSESGIGKSTIALQIASNICKQGKKIIYIDSEGSVTREILETTGNKEYLNNNFFYIRESTFSNVEKYLDMYLATNEISFVFVDSLASLINEGYTNLKDGISIMSNNTNYATKPLVMFINKYHSLSISKKFCLIVINQYRNKVDMRKGTILKEFGSKNVKYQSDVIIKISPITSQSRHKDFKGLNSGVTLEFETIKSNKTSPGISYPFFLLYGKGISNTCSYINALINLGIIKLNGTYFSLENDCIYIKEQGFEKFYNKIVEMDLDLIQYYSTEINNYYNSINVNY